MRCVWGDSNSADFHVLLGVVEHQRESPHAGELLESRVGALNLDGAACDKRPSLSQMAGYYEQGQDRQSEGWSAGRLGHCWALL